MQEKEARVLSGGPMLFLAILAWLAVPVLIVLGIKFGHGSFGAAGILLFVVALLLSMGLFIVQPNEARVLVLFGKYIGTAKKNGYYWANPFSVRSFTSTAISSKDGSVNVPTLGIQNKLRVSLRARNFQTGILKVNDQRGNPIDIGAVVVWRVADTAKALFDVDAYENYVQIQSETALRHLANTYPYDLITDDNPKNEITLRGSEEIITNALEKELEERLSKAGVSIDEARLMHLAYSPEIAGAMLRRQQAEAIIAARKKIVIGAVSMVEMALTLLYEKHVVELDEERKAAMVSNLLVVLCGEKGAEPIINTGTLYQ